LIPNHQQQQHNNNNQQQQQHPQFSNTLQQQPQTIHEDPESPGRTKRQEFRSFPYGIIWWCAVPYFIYSSNSNNINTMMNGGSNLANPPDASVSDDGILDDHLHDDEDDDSVIRGNVGGSGSNDDSPGVLGFIMGLIKDLWHSSGIVLNNKLNWLLIMGPIALLGDATGLLGETACFAFSGLALIPCAERYVRHYTTLVDTNTDTDTHIRGEMREIAEIQTLIVSESSYVCNAQGADLQRLSLPIYTGLSFSNF
jgi:hypothetical protein